MADLSLVTDKYFTIASETFTDNLSSSIAAGAATVPVLNNSEYTNGDDVVLTVDPGTVNEATFIGRKSGLNFINCVWTEGNTAVGHNNGATVIDYDSATHHSAQSKGILKFATSAGALLTQPVRDALGLGATAANGWEVLPYTLAVSSGYNKGDKEFDITVANNDLRTVLSANMKLRLQRNIAAPTQCTDLESTSTQYASKTTPTGIVFTDDFSTEAWVKPESITGTPMTIVSRYTTTGFLFFLTQYGQVCLEGGGGTDDLITSYISLRINEWAHIAATLDMSGSLGTVYINGISVPTFYTNGAATGITQAGNLQIGTYNTGSGLFDGKISDVRVWNVIRTQTQIRDNMNQQLVGSETNLVAYYKLNGDFNDSTTNANHLTASGGAVATNVDNPMKTTEYMVIKDVTYSAPNTTITVYTGVDNAIPNMTLTAPYYSTQAAPYNLPNSLGSNPLQIGECLSMINATTSSSTAVQVPGVTKTINAVAGRKYRLWVQVFDLFTSGATVGAELSLWVGTVGSGVQLNKQLGFSPGGSAASPAGFFADYVAPTTAAIVLGAGILTTNVANGATAQAAITYPLVFKIEQL